jgi:NAD(P)-dependent dehydrogenase (short-subunit alcohol dehydrogenase family)
MANETVGTMKDTVAIITGGSRGLGRNTAVNLAGRGVNVIFTYRSNQKEADSLIREVEAMERKAAGFQLDTGDIHAFDGFAADVRKTLHGWGRDRFNYLVNNAGGSLHANFDQTSEAQFDEIVNVHFKGVYFLTQKLLPLIPHSDCFGLTSYPEEQILGLYVYPRCKRTTGIAAGDTGSVDSAHTDLWIAARARDRTRHPGNLGRRAARRAWRALSRTSAVGRARLDLGEVGSFFK